MEMQEKTFSYLLFITKTENTISFILFLDKEWGKDDVLFLFQLYNNVYYDIKVYFIILFSELCRWVKFCRNKTSPVELLARGDREIKENNLIMWGLASRLMATHNFVVE